MIKHLLFVCSGNTCRSPMAAELFRMRIEDHPTLRHVQVSSAGTDAHGAHAEDDAISVLRDLYRRDISKHVPTRLGAAHADVDLVLVMKEDLVASARRLVPSARVERLGDFVGAPQDVADPYRRGPAEYRACARQLDDLMAALVQTLERAGE